MSKSAMSRRDIVTGLWESTYFNRNKINYVRSYIDLDGYDSITETRRASSIWGDIENIRQGKNGHTKADLYDGSDFLGGMIFHRNIDLDRSYSYLDGTISLNLRNGKGTLWDDDLANHWVAKVKYDI
jgi:hypothetical protein